MPRVRNWFGFASNSGTSTVVDSVTGDPVVQLIDNATLLRTIVAAQVTAYGVGDPYDNTAGRAMPLVRVFTAGNTDGPAAGWPFLFPEESDALISPLQVTAATMVQPDAAQDVFQSTVLHLTPEPGTTDTKSMRKIPSGQFPATYWYIGGVDSGPQSGLLFSYRMYCKQLFEYDA